MNSHSSKNSDDQDKIYNNNILNKLSQFKRSGDDLVSSINSILNFKDIISKKREIIAL